MEGDAHKSQQQLDRVALKIPPFWKKHPAMWFTQLEMQFELSGITTDHTKFFYVASNLNEEIAMEVTDIILNPPAIDKYNKLKSELIKRLSSSDEQKLKQLLEREEMGDRSPSQFLRYIKNLAGSGVSETLLRTLWIGRLPSSIQCIISAFDSKNLKDVAAIADKIQENTQPNKFIGSVSNTVNQSEVDMLRKEINELKLEIRSMAKGNSVAPNRNRYRGRSRSRSQSRSRPSGMCYQVAITRDSIWLTR